jgi:hypothetical protein
LPIGLERCHPFSTPDLKPGGAGLDRTQVSPRIAAVRRALALVAASYLVGVGVLTYLIYIDTQQPPFDVHGRISSPPFVDSIPAALTIALIAAVPLAALPGSAVALWWRRRSIEATLATGASLGMLAVVGEIVWVRRYGLDPDLATLDSQVLFSTLFFAPAAVAGGLTLGAIWIAAGRCVAWLRATAGPPQFGLMPPKGRPRPDPSA